MNLAALLPHQRLEKFQRMDQVIRPSINVQIILPEDTPAATSSQEPPTRHCGDEIRGHLEVSTYGNFEFEVNVSFEGLVRTWVGLENNRDPSQLPPTAEFQFLQENQKVFSDPSTRCYEGDLCIHFLPFRFVVPHELISARSDIHSDFLKLCPSTKQGLAFRGPTARKTYQQPMIIYMIIIKSIKTDIVVENFMRSTYQREITIMPYTPAAPPLVIEAFPREYTSSITTTLKQHRWRRSLGVLKISAAEPSPLNILALAPRPSTFVVLSLAFTPNYPCDFDTRPCEWNYVVKQYLRIRTFYSTRTLDRMPTFTAAETDPLLRIRDKRTALEVREYSNISWNKDYQPRLSEQDIPSDEEERCPMVTTLRVPINAARSLLPTFLNPLSARQYAVVLRLGIKELSHGAIELILPVQVIYYPPHGTGLGIDEGEITEGQNVIVSSVSHPPHQFMTLDNDAPPPPYDL